MAESNIILSSCALRYWEIAAVRAPPRDGDLHWWKGPTRVQQECKAQGPRWLVHLAHGWVGGSLSTATMCSAPSNEQFHLARVQNVFIRAGGWAGGWVTLAAVSTAAGILLFTYLPHCCRLSIVTVAASGMGRCFGAWISCPVHGGRVNSEGHQRWRRYQVCCVCGIVLLLYVCVRLGMCYRQ